MYNYRKYVNEKIAKKLMQKEIYFTNNNINQKAVDMLAAVYTFRDLHNQIKFSPKNSALLILDMQEYFLSKQSHAFIPSAPAIIPIIKALIDIFNSQQLPIIFTRHINTSNNANMMAKWWKELISATSRNSRIISDLNTENGKILSKNQYDAFFKTSLEKELRSKKVRKLVVTGVMTHLCCETTARSAFMRGFEVFFIVDGTATYNERFHCGTLVNLSHGFVIPMLGKEILHAFKDLKNAHSHTIRI